MKKLLMAGLCAGLILSSPAQAAEDYADHAHHAGMDMSGNMSDHSAHLKADTQGPAGVMRNHMHHKDSWMLSYRFMRMEMKDNREGTNSLSPEDIVTNVANRFSATAGQPPTLRVVPTDMRMDMHMLGAMYAPADWLTLMLMGTYLDNSMDHITFQGGAGTTRLGEFTTKSSGIGDTKASGLFRLYQDGTHHLHMSAGISAPTGSIDKEDEILTPMNMRPRERLPYAMQLGSGTWDLLPGLTYRGQSDRFGWGAQYSGTVHLGENSEDYTWGDKHILTGWASYLWAPQLSTSLRLSGETESKIDGIDSEIVLPVQTADPDRYGGQRFELGLGANLMATSGFLKGQALRAEVTLPLYQDLNGPQLERDYAFTIGWSVTF